MTLNVTGVDDDFCEIASQMAPPSFSSKREEWAFYLLEMGSRMQQPLRWVSREVHRVPTPLPPGFSTEKVRDLFRRIIYGWIVPSYTALACAISAAFGSVIYWLGTVLRQNNFTHCQTNAPEKKISDLHQRTVKAMLFDVRGWFGGTSLWKGVPEWEARIDQLTTQLLQEDPDVLFLSEVDDPALTQALFERLQERLAHFFLYPGKASGFLIASKFPIKDFSFSNFSPAKKEGFANFSLISDEKVFSRITLAHFPSDAANAERIDLLIQSISDQHLQNPVEERFIPKVFAASGIGPKEYEILSQTKRLFDQESQPVETSRDFPPFLWEGESQGKVTDILSVIRRLADGQSIPNGGSTLRKIDLSPGYDDKGVRTSDHMAMILNLQLPQR